MEKDIEDMLEFLDDTDAIIVIESEYNYQFLYDLLEEKVYDTKFSSSRDGKDNSIYTVKTDEGRCKNISRSAKK